MLYSEKDEIKKKLAFDLQPFAEKAIDHFFWANPRYRPVGDIHDAFLQETIRSIAVDLKSTYDAGLAAGRVPVRLRAEYSVDNLLRSNLALDRISPEVEELRREVFGKAGAPFKSLTAALIWLAKEARSEEAAFHAAKGDVRQRVKVLEAKIYRLLDERNELAEGSWLLDLHFSEPVPLGGFYTFPGTRLRRLVLGIRILAAVSKFQEQSLYRFLLTGVRPIRRLMDVTFLGPVTVRDFIDYYNRLPAKFRNDRRVTVVGVAALNFVQGLGDPPKKNKMKFWREATAAWNKDRRRRKYRSRLGLKKAYDRALKKFPG